VAVTEDIVTILKFEKSHTILIVEDEPLLRMITAEVLEEAGYSVVEAVNASEALELLDARADFSLMITDVRMPGELNGYSLSRLVRMKYPKLPIIVLSGDSVPGDGDLPFGALFMPKPVSPSELLDMTAQFLEKSAFATTPFSQHSNVSEIKDSPVVGETASDGSGDGSALSSLQPHPERDKS
jgi:CheY-like chemotaxis protein